MPRDWVTRLQEAVEVRTGKTVIDQGRVELLEAAAKEGFALRRELDLIGWSVMDYLGSQPQEVRFEERIKMARQARNVWAQDPQAGAAVDLACDFTFGRGVSKPRCRDEAVQEVVDEAWDDADNQLVLTSYEAQIAANTDLELQSNVFLLMFDEGEDGKVKLSLLNHDTVEQVVRDPDNRLRVLYYLAKVQKQAWDFDNDRPAFPDMMRGGGLPHSMYYAHWKNVEVADEDGGREEKVPRPPDAKLGHGKVRHVAVNRTTEMAFGVPTMRRTIRWFTAYNDFMKARVDMAQAAAAFIMKRTAKGSPEQLAKLAAKSVSRQADLPVDPDVGVGMAGPKPASILTENESLVHENMRLDSGAGNATQDGQMLRSQISAATHFPQHYLGDAGSANLATATSMELPVLKHIEGRQEVWEGVFRWFVDRVIEKAVDDGRLDRYADEEPLPEEVSGQPVFGPESGAPDLGDPQSAVERIFPEDYQDPAIAAAQAQMGGAPGAPPGFPGQEGDQHQAANPYGAPMQGTPPEQVQQALDLRSLSTDALWDLQWKLPEGHPIREAARAVSEARYRDLPEMLQLAQRGRGEGLDKLFNEEVSPVVDEVLTGLMHPGNGNGKH
jgi:hypothetical protein